MREFLQQCQVEIRGLSSKIGLSLVHRSLMILSIGMGMLLMEGESSLMGGGTGVGMGVLPVAERLLLAEIDFKEGANG